MTRLEALAHGQAPAAEAPCCPFHATGGHPDDRHGFDPASVVYGAAEPHRDTDPAIELAARARAGALLAKAGHVGYGRRLVSRHLREDVARAGERLAYLERRGQLDDLGRAALVAVVDLADAIGARAYLDNMIAKDIASVERRFGLTQEPRP